MRRKGAGKSTACRLREQERKIDELERTVQLIEEARCHYVDQYDFAVYGCVTLDEKGCILELNITAAKLLGRVRSGLMGLPLFSFIAKSHLTAFFSHLRQCRHTQEKIVTEVVIGRRGKPQTIIELSSVPVLDMHTGRTVYRTVLLDITERRLAEQKLRQSEERFSTVFRASPSPILITTLAEGRFIDVNPSFCKLTGYSHEEVIGCTAVELGFHSSAASRERLVADLRKHGSFQNVEVQVATKSGAKRSVMGSGELIKLDGEECILMIGQDVTDLKRLQGEVLEISEREQARIGRDLHDGACQDLSCISLLAEVAARNLALEKSRTAENVREISELARQTLNDVRSLATGLVPVKIEQYGLEGALQELAQSTSARNHIRCSFIMRKWVTILDQNAAVNLYRIAQEAVSNAVRHGHAANILIELARPNGTVNLIIQDDGSGLPRRSKKSGLGLHTMQYRAKMLGGSFKVGPAAMHGTVVICSFPGENFAASEAKASLYRA